MNLQNLVSRISYSRESEHNFGPCDNTTEPCASFPSDSHPQGRRRPLDFSFVDHQGRVPTEKRFSRLAGEGMATGTSCHSPACLNNGREAGVTPLHVVEQGRLRKPLPEGVQERDRKATVYLFAHVNHPLFIE